MQLQQLLSHCRRKIFFSDWKEGGWLIVRQVLLPMDGWSRQRLHVPVPWLVSQFCLQCADVSARANSSTSSRPHRYIAFHFRHINELLFLLQCRLGHAAAFVCRDARCVVCLCRLGCSRHRLQIRDYRLEIADCFLRFNHCHIKIDDYLLVGL